MYKELHVCSTEGGVSYTDTEQRSNSGRDEACFSCIHTQSSNAAPFQETARSCGCISLCYTSQLLWNSQKIKVCFSDSLLCSETPLPLFTVHIPNSSPTPPSPLLNAPSVPQPRGESSRGIQCQPALIAALNSPPERPEALCVFTSLHFHLTGLTAGGLNRVIQGRLQFPFHAVLNLTGSGGADGT